MDAAGELKVKKFETELEKKDELSSNLDNKIKPKSKRHSGSLDYHVPD